MEKTFSSLIFWKHDAVNEFYGAIDVSFQMKGTEFAVIHGLDVDRRKDRRKKRYDFPIDFSPTCISLNVKFTIPTKSLESYLHF